MYSVWFCHMYILIEILNVFYQKLWLLTVSGVILTNISTVLEFPEQLYFIYLFLQFSVGSLFPRPSPAELVSPAVLRCQCLGLCSSHAVQRSCCHRSVAAPPRPLQSQIQGALGRLAVCNWLVPWSLDLWSFCSTGSPGNKEQLQAACAAGQPGPFHCAQGCFS